MLKRRDEKTVAKVIPNHNHSLLNKIGSRLGATMDRRAFLKRSGIGVGAGAVAGSLPFGMVRKAEAAAEGGAASGAIEIKRTICSHCSVGCATDAVVQNGVWVRQNPVFDSPINLGAHCAKGAALREHGHGEHRLKYPMKLVNGKYEKISWDEALEAVSKKMMELREANGPDSLFFIGSSKHSNEQAYLLRKWVSLWGTNNCDHQARICHSTTVAGVANTWGYGAMTNSYNDMQNTKCALYIGSNAAEAHPVSMMHMLHAKETGAKMIVVDPRFTRTAARADEYVRIRSGSDIPFLFGLLHHIFKNGWEDKKYINDRVYGMDQIKADVMANWTPDKVEEACGVGEAQMYKVAEMMAKSKPSTIVWCMGQTQHTIGNAMVRASCILQLALGNIGISGGGANIFRGHCNVQGATDVGPNPDSLPGYYGVAEGSWKHWCRVWGLDYEYVQSRYAEGMITKGGMTVSRWVDGVLENPELIDQKAGNLRGLFFWGHAPNSQTRGLDMKKAMDKLDLLVIVDPYPTAAAAMAAMPGDPAGLNPNREVYLLPATTQFESSGSITASNRSIQWREKVIEPLFDSRNDHMIMYQLAEKLGFEKELTKNLTMVKGKGGMMEPEIESILREINKGTWTIGYTGQSPERLKLHMKNMHTFNVRTLKAEGGPCDGEYFGLPWPCYGTPEAKHPGSPNLYQTDKHVMDGGGNFRANFGVEKDGVNLLAEDGSHSLGAEITTGYPEFTADMVKQLGWWDDLTEAEKAEAEGKNWKTDLSGGIQRVVMKHGCHPFGNAKARAVVWNFPDPVPKHREPLYSTKPDLVAKYPTHDDKAAFWRLPTLYKSVQEKNADIGKSFPLIMTSGRLVEYEGGGEETRSNPWLAELQQTMFVEINPAAANDRGIKHGDTVRVTTPTGAKIEVQAQVTRRVGPDTVFLPFHFSGHWEGKDMISSYPEGSAPIVRGESVNTATTYGYDVVTMMQETKTTVCQIEKLV
ncbi:MAG: twin-arginine translocation signal domain-containing protein [Limnobacter sp.]|jgi:formate dehydrogenase major subunit|uniref:Molybdopterin-dependent oxidoreductase n=5 Tax=Pseudomonadota TaxID=1224 RepID=A0ABX6N752_9BURK|nr:MULTISPECIES: molybdopterin-dependent oxidoreductase [unclassified Limnobacter]MBA4314664.1 formate dehydrogenase [Alcaligenaceae bacterium]MDP3272060.1 molybdopterin-dependent oxidoreductase [Limnobacter sp.]MDZ4049593.1 molybdopterin-dependent oxidoreductase [Limnobacter sp.]QJR29514.1 molybdopterin-dependent oxidoreductase [Limnobacter sp. SAORIC-580]RZO91248.1 MAG: twin-arginine translocation signal domain-containing protein [Limnobacter sp.]